MTSSGYGWLMLAGIAVSAWFWSRHAKRDSRLVAVYVGALMGAFVGAKVAYLVAEGWQHWRAADMWLQLATGKSILGALLGGYVGVELAKKAIGYERVTGDWFAAIVPVSIIIGRVGCFLHGCCLGAVCESSWWTVRDAAGLARWPAVPVEIAFNVVALAVFGLLRQRRQFAGQHFHLYLIGYGVFRLMHESLRATPRLVGDISGYQLVALVVAVVGVAAFVRRAAATDNALVSSIVG